MFRHLAKATASATTTWGEEKITQLAAVHDFNRPNGVVNHEAEAIQFFKTFPDQHLANRPYKTFFASGDWTCSIARFTGTMTGAIQGTDGKEIPPTGKSFDVDFCTVARWDNGQIVEENLFNDLVTFMRKIGLGS